MLSCSIVPVGAMKKDLKKRYAPKINKDQGNGWKVTVPTVKKNDQPINGGKIKVPTIKKEQSILDDNGKIRQQYLDEKGNFKTEKKNNKKN